MNDRVQVDIVIVGGGVAGLWLLSRLRSMGFGALLVEGLRLGAGQTLRSQGVIHGSGQYRIEQDTNDEPARAVADLPEVWRRCLAGEGEVDLRDAKMLTPRQYVCNVGDTSKSWLRRLFSRKNRPPTGGEAPEPLAKARLAGQVYGLDEPVVTTDSLLHCLARPHLDAIVLNASYAVLAGDGGITLRGDGPGQLVVRSQRIILAAGTGNGFFGVANMKLRPMHMVMIRSRRLPRHVCLHVVGTGNEPRLSITAHGDRQGRCIWYLGGAFAAQGAKRPAAQQIAAARKLLGRLMPGLDLTGAEFSTLQTDRAEPRVRRQAHAEGPGVSQSGSIITVWPTWLSMVPLMSEQVLKLLRQDGISPRHTDLSPFAAFARPVVADYPWDEPDREWTR